MKKSITTIDKVFHPDFDYDKLGYEFSKLVASVSQDNYEFAAALLNTKVLQDGDEIIFEG